MIATHIIVARVIGLHACTAAWVVWSRVAFRMFRRPGPQLQWLARAAEANRRGRACADRAQALIEQLRRPA